MRHGSKWNRDTARAIAGKECHKWCLLPSLCGECCPGCLLPSLCGECIHFGLGFGTRRFGFGHHLLLQFSCGEPPHQLPKKCMHGRATKRGANQKSKSEVPYRGAPPLQSGGQNQKWPTSGQIGYLTPAVSGSPTAAERGAKSEVAHKWAKWLPHPCRIGEPHRCRAGGKIRSGPQVGKLATSPLPYRGAPPLQSGGQNQKWPTSGQIGYLTPAVSGSPTASKRGVKSEVAHKWAKWLPHPCRIGDPHRCRAGGKIRSGPQVGKLATSPLPYRGAPPLQSGGQNQKWPTSGQIGYLTPAVSGSPTASKRGVKSEVAHKWANWLPHPCRIGDPHRFRAGGKIRIGAQKRAGGGRHGPRSARAKRPLGAVLKGCP